MTRPSFALLTASSRGRRGRGSATWRGLPTPSPPLPQASICFSEDASSGACGEEAREKYHTHTYTYTHTYTHFYQKNPRVRKIRVRNSGAGNGCANLMDTWKKCVLSAGKTLSVKFPFLGGGWGGGSADFIFMGARIFLILHFKEDLAQSSLKPCCLATHEGRSCRAESGLNLVDDVCGFSLVLWESELACARMSQWVLSWKY